jgi:transaldolase
LVNLILSIVGALLAFVVLVAFFVGRKEEKEKDEYAKEGTYTQSTRRRKRIGVRIVSIIAAIAAIIVFVLTEDMRLPMQMVDMWTILHAVILIVQLVLTAFATRKKSDDDTKPLAPAQAPAA